MPNATRIVRNAGLEPFWGVLRATEPGFMRSLITWMGGPEGYINTNVGHAVESQTCAVGIMDMAVANRQPGVHVHTMVEIYVILDGHVESIDGMGTRHIAGPLDCLYIPKGVPHGVRTVGDTDVKLLWVNDDIERWDAAVYLEGPGPHPADDAITLVKFHDLEPDWSGARQPPGGMHWNINWVAGDAGMPSYNAGHAVPNGRIGIGLSVVLPANRMIEAPMQHNQLFVVVRGRAVTGIADSSTIVGRQDAIFVPAGTALDLRALDDTPLYLVRIIEPKAA